LVDSRAQVGLIDVDSFQVTTSEGLCPCRVGTADTTPPELQAVSDFSKVVRQVEHDAFGVAVLVFQMLSEGTHAFDGRVEQSASQRSTLPPDITERIARNLWPYSSKTAGKPTVHPPEHALDYRSFPSRLAGLFERAFDGGFECLSNRPAATDFSAALSEFDVRLVPCKKNARHYHLRGLSQCPWCERAKRLQFDLYA
jgi:DNA-binding helix-hairpin-helix protein with protein kinase domain